MAPILPITIVFLRKVFLADKQYFKDTILPKKQTYSAIKAGKGVTYIPTFRPKKQFNKNWLLHQFINIQ